MFREKFIAKVPALTIEEAKFVGRRWERTFNIASWVRFRTARPNRIALILKYLDSEGAKSIEVDHCNTELETMVLLSSQITLKGKGKVEEMSLYLEVEDNSAPYVVDELYVQNAGSNATDNEKIISSAA